MEFTVGKKTFFMASELEEKKRKRLLKGLS
jgi:hypothetical protein